MNTNNNVLFIDAEVSILESIKRMLLGCEVNGHYAATIDEALNIIESTDIDTMFIDITRGNLVELLEKVQESHPSIVKVVISDYAHLTTIINSIRKLNLHSFLLKPWKKHELIETVESANDYAKFLKLQTQEKENLEQKNVIYQRIINFKDDVGEANKADIGTLKTGLLLASSEYESLINENNNNPLLLKSISAVNELFISMFPTFLEKFSIPDLKGYLNIDKTTINYNETDAVYVKNLTLIKELIIRVINFISSFFNGEGFQVDIEGKEKDIAFKISGYFNEQNKYEFERFLSCLAKMLKNVHVTITTSISNNHFEISFEI